MPGRHGLDEALCRCDRRHGKCVPAYAGSMQLSGVREYECAQTRPQHWKASCLSLDSTKKRLAVKHGSRHERTTEQHGTTFGLRDKGTHTRATQANIYPAAGWAQYSNAWNWTTGCQISNTSKYLSHECPVTLEESRDAQMVKGRLRGMTMMCFF